MLILLHGLNWCKKRTMASHLVELMTAMDVLFVFLLFEHAIYWTECIVAVDTGAKPKHIERPFLRWRNK